MSWTETTQALAAAVGAIGTPAAVLIGIRSLRWQQNQHEEQRNRLELEQPRNIIVTSCARDWPTVDGQTTYRTLVATVANLGAQTVYDTTLQWRCGAEEKVGGSDFKGPLVPGEQWERPAPVKLLHQVPLEEIGVFVTFFDADSRGWAKTQRGKLARLRDAFDEAW